MALATALILTTLLAVVGPIWLPFALAKRRRGVLFSFFLTNAITILPMVGLVAWARHLPPPPCRELYPPAPCDGIPYDGAWGLVTILFLGLAVWGLIASLVATAAAFGSAE
jgi:hypothetical protein